MTPLDGPRSAVVFNPVKVRDIDALRDEVSTALHAAGWPPPSWHQTSVEDPGRGLTQRIVADGADVVFVCGGDGTVMSCAGALAGSDAVLAILPSGTGNLLAANLGLPTDRPTAIGLATHGARRRIDLGLIDAGTAEDACFTVMAGMGFDAHLLDATPEPLKARLGWFAYVVGGVRSLSRRPMNVTVRADDHPPLDRRARAVLVANVGRLQGGIRLLADARPDDGWLDVAILTPRTLRDWLAMAAALYRRRPRVPRLEVIRCREVRVTSDRPQDRELDGDLITRDRTLHATVLPQSLTLCVPTIRPGAEPARGNDRDRAAEPPRGTAS
jgi:diacylglycerol kinase family enzyme